METLVVFYLSACVICLYGQVYYSHSFLFMLLLFPRSAFLNSFLLDPKPGMSLGQWEIYVPKFIKHYFRVW